MYSTYNKERKTYWIVHILLRKCFLKQEAEEMIDVTGRGEEGLSRY
jgi:hypothetical protein